MSKLKILCLHGWGENGTYFRTKTSALVRSVEDLVDPVYITAPYPMLHSVHDSTDILEEEVTEESKSYCWWNPRRNDITVKNKTGDPNEKGWNYLIKVLTEQGPFDGILGFSQGGTIAAILSALLQGQDVMPNPLGPERIHPPLKFVIIVSAVIPPPSSGFTALFMQPTKIKLPSMHIMGELDTTVMLNKMEELAACYEDPVIARHPGGHFVPSLTSVRKALKSFISSLYHKLPSSRLTP